MSSVLGEVHPPNLGVRKTRANPGQQRLATVSLVEADSATCLLLEAAVREELKEFFHPIIVNDEFARALPDLLNHPIYRRCKRVATFALVDPCGVLGVNLADLRSLVYREFSECLVFWNYSGLNRLLGGVVQGTYPRRDLVGFFGRDPVLELALGCFLTHGESRRKEIELLNLYLRALHDEVAKYILPFRFSARGQERTSHYLIHCSNNATAFKIMKEVMWRLTTEASDAGTYEYLASDELGAQTPLFRPAFDAARMEVLKELGISERPVSLFTKEWVLRPNDYLVEQEYKQVLLGLESEDLIELVDPKSGVPKPRGHRLRKGIPTMGESLIVRRK